MVRPRMADGVTAHTTATKQQRTKRSDSRPPWGRCALRCSLFSEAKCGRCRIPGDRGEPRCPVCRGRLSYLEYVPETGRARWGCSSLRGCGATVSVPTTDPALEASADAELLELKRQKARMRQAMSRARKRVRKQAAPAGAGDRG